MQSPFSYTDSYTSSPGGMDFFFYGPPVYDNVCDVDTHFVDVMPEPYTFTSGPSAPGAPYACAPTMPDFTVYDPSVMATSMPSPTSSCGSSYSSSFHVPEEVPVPKYHFAPAPSEDVTTPDSPPAPSKPAKPFACDACRKTFTRFADLKRHQSSVHYPVFRNCPVEHCSRKGSNGFPRQDHLVEHLRSYHHLDVPKRRALKRSAKDMA
ncbi:hypothetical protein N7470_005444 [Penicillium chermesinum]|nr:hypothetical protein N7470_005444 [Penicillium chermesinum]